VGTQPEPKPEAPTELVRIDEKYCADQDGVVYALEEQSDIYNLDDF
jgi:hypothetical protein